MTAIALIHLCFGGISEPLSYVNKVLLFFFFATPALSSKMMPLNITTIWKAFPQYINKYNETCAQRPP